MSDSRDLQAVSVWVHMCGRLAPLASILVFMSPIPTMQKIIHDRKVGTLPLLPYSTMIASTYLWLVYGFLKSEPTIWFSNGTGLFLGILYFLTFQNYSPKSSPTLPGSIEKHFLGIVAVVGLATLLPLVGPMISSSIDSAEIVGKAGVIFCVGLFASPLAALKTVLETKSARSIPLPFTVASVVNCFLWTVFGWFKLNDSNVYIPNILGLSFGLIQVGLKSYYSDSAYKKAKLESMDEEMILHTDSAV